MSEIREGKRRRLKAIPKTRNGHAAAIEPGSMRWTSSDESVVTVTPDPTNELEADVDGVDGSNNDSVFIEARADGIRGEGVRELIATKSYVCTQGDASVFEFDEGEETDIELEPAAGGGEPITETQTIGSGDVGSVDEVITNSEGGGVGSGAGNTANQGVDANPSAGLGSGTDAAGTTPADESNQPPADTGEAMTFDEAAADTEERNADTATARQSDTAAVDEGDATDQ